VNATECALLLALAFWCGSAFAQSEAEPSAIVELGAAAARNFKDGSSSFGPAVAIEATPIENWLEIEVVLHRSSDATRRNGTPTYYSKSPGPFQRKRSLWLVLALSGFTPANMA
jgi:hypothetical protein